jgi:hypothetical protein
MHQSQISTSLPATLPDEFYRRYPELKRKTFDICPACIEQGMREMTDWMSQYKEV